MAPNKVSVTIRFTKAGLQPPVYLAGSFSNPAWLPLPMQYIIDEHNEHQYHKDIEVEEGAEYQYKFRLGEGDWWVLNEESPIATDDIGNRNNLLTIPVSKEAIHTPQEQSKPSDMESSNDGAVDPVPKIDNVKPEVEHKEEVAIKEDNPTAEPLVVDADDTGAAKQGEEDLAVVDPRPEVEIVEPEVQSAEREIQQNDEITIKGENFTAGSPVVLADEKGDVKAIKHEEFNLNGDLSNGDLTHIDPKPEPPKDDNVGGDVTSSPKGADLLKTPNSEPDYVVVRADTHTPDLARVAADVADSAEILDQRTPTPEIGDEEAGRLGLRRMSETPIPEVANTAAEVADSAAILDKEDAAEIKEVAQEDVKPEVKEEVKKEGEKEPFNIEIPTPNIGVDGPESPGSGTVTPWEERVPRFSHECPELPDGDVRPACREHDDNEGKGPRDPFESSAIDPNDPSIEEFPSEREAIFEQVRSCQRRMSEDQPSIEAAPPSPVVGVNNHIERFDLPSPSPNIFTKNEARSPSLLSIQEEHGDHEELPALPKSITHPKSEPDLRDATTKDERETSVEVHEVAVESPPAHSSEPFQTQVEEQVGEPHISPGQIALPDTPFSVDDSKQLDSEDGSPQEIVNPVNGPSITVQPSTPGTSMMDRGSDPFERSIDIAKTTAIEEENGRNGHAQLTSRKTTSPVPDRPLTPASLRSAPKDAESKNFLKAFLNLVFVEWIGGFIMRLCGGRHTLLAIFALLVITVAPALYLSRLTGATILSDRLTSAPIPTPLQEHTN